MYDKRKFAAITIRIDNPKTTALLFSSGKLVVTGSVSRQMAMCAVRRIIIELKALALFRFVRYDRHIIQNIVCNVRLPRDKVSFVHRWSWRLHACVRGFEICSAVPLSHGAIYTGH